MWLKFFLVLRLAMQTLLDAPGKSNLHSSCEWDLGIALESLQGK